MDSYYFNHLPINCINVITSRPPKGNIDRDHPQHRSMFFISKNIIVCSVTKAVLKSWIKELLLEYFYRIIHIQRILRLKLLAKVASVSFFDSYRKTRHPVVNTCLQS